jgi:iron complex transport system ATP-binding protein
MEPPVIEFRDATLIRGGVPVLEHLWLSVAPGEHTAVLGPNGAGKSSLIRMLTLDDRPRAGANGVAPLRLFGRASWDLAELRLRLGVVTGDLDAGFGIGTSGGRVRGLDVALSGLLGSHGVFAHHEVNDAMRDRARGALDRVEALHLASKPLNEMSAGERRRVLIARALITTPEALVLDEPTAGLDPVARHRFMESIRRLARDGTTLILVTHHIDEIIPEIKRVVLLRKGRVAFDGTADETLTSQRLADVFGGPLVVERSEGYYHVRPAPRGIEQSETQWPERSGR